MSKHKIFSNMMNNMLENFGGQLIYNADIKTKFGANACNIDALLRIERLYFFSHINLIME